ncbi:PH domain-containing protein [Sphingomonas sp. S2-65]|uniref:PH domain-containing protein n=1 Tax=Sphingomonas sp. S2-65 TaxID=2903960 RepID=UPI001F1FB276|nr:PH domain-containing protein [Sphingomonas sp. S2-65]UYY59926.1 PH domain-containing protein [Sphingomonas sp. S2-65]
MPQTIDRFRSSTAGWLRGSLAGWGTLLLLLASFVASFYFLAQGTLQGTALLAPALLAAALGIIAAKWLTNLAIAYEVTDDRLILHSGIVMKSIDEIELYRVKDVRIDFSIINQAADIGTITLCSSDETTRDQPLVMRDIPRARARREKLRTLVNAARQSRGVREIDLADEDLAPR